MATTPSKAPVAHSARKDARSVAVGLRMVIVGSKAARASLALGVLVLACVDTGESENYK